MPRKRSEGRHSLTYRHRYPFRTERLGLYQNREPFPAQVGEKLPNGAKVIKVDVLPEYCRVYGVFNG